ncbi:SGNH/GDSL hydrolase family protein [Alkalicoccus luteus]|uniref:SGNH/GDSL hydrolase family protein n=1 Tax=Alkalicoccus luteus TaxID=1237094 RepID=UPI00403331A6
MQRITLLIVVVLTGVTVLVGRLYYQDQLQATADQAHEQLAASAGIDAEELEVQDDEEADEAAVVLEEAAEDENELEESAYEDEELEQLTSELPNSIADRIAERLSAGEAVRVLTVGTRSSTDAEDEGLTPWPELLEEELNEAYGEGTFQFTNVSFGGFTTEEIVEQNRHDDLADNEADILLLEGFNWNNNLAVVTGDDAHEQIDAIAEAATADNSDLITVLHPSPPAYETSIYPEQVADFAEFAEEEGYVYIDHWEAWPDLDDEELLNYVTEERMPNQDGHTLWAEAIRPYLVTQ